MLASAHDLSHIPHAKLILNYGYFGLFPLMILEGPILTFIAGYLASLGLLHESLVIVTAIAANLAGDFGLYAIGRHGVHPFIKRFGRFVRVDLKTVEKFSSIFHRHAVKTLVFGKISGVFSYPILLSAGATRYPLKRFSFICPAVEIPKSAFIALLGFFFGAAYKNFDKYLSISVAGFVVIALLIAGYIYLTRRATKSLEHESDKGV